MLLMKNIFEEQQIIQKAHIIFGEVNQLMENEEGEQFLETIASYLLYATELEPLKLIEKMRTISPKAEEKFTSTAMRLEMKGRLEGRLEGIEKGVKKVAFSLLKQGIADEVILAATKLTQKELNYLKSLKEFELDLEIV